MKIISARTEEADALTKIAFAAKGHWGYPPSWIRQWKDQLTITPAYIETHPTFVARVDETIVGFCALQIDSGETWLDHLWVVPTYMRTGIGRALFRHAESIARGTGAPWMKIVGDPNAEGFYVRMGATVYGRQLANMGTQERYLPLLQKPL